MATDTNSEKGPKLRFCVLGGLSIELCDKSNLVLTNKKAAALLAYLALSQNGNESRERLVGLLWSDRPESQARASLRQCLRQLQVALDAIEFQGFWKNRQSVGLNANTYTIEIKELSASLDCGFMSNDMISAETTPDRILYGFENLDPSFDAWLHVIRHSWTEHFLDQMQIVLRDRSDDIESVRRAAESLILIDTTHEEAHRHLIRYHADSGNIAAALKQYKTLWDLLDEEHDMEPSEATQDLIVEIKSGTYQSSDKQNRLLDPQEQQTQTVVAPEKLSLAPRQFTLPIIQVRPFLCGGPWSQDPYLIEGFRRDLIAALVRFREWIVVDAIEGIDPDNQSSLNTSMQYQLESAYFEDDRTVRLVITLKDAQSHRYIWSEQVELTPESWFDVQQRVVRRISLSLNHYVSAERLSRVTHSHDLPYEIHDRWLQGYELSLIWTRENQERAEAIFQSIIDDAPAYSHAFSSLAILHHTKHIRSPGVFRDKQLEAEALRLAQISVNIDPLDARNQMTLAWCYLMHERYDQAELHFDLTQELNANNPTTMMPCAQGLNYCGHHRRAVQLSEMAIRLNQMLPRYHWGYVMCIRFFAKDFEASLEAAERAGDAITDFLGWKAAILAYLGRKAETEHAVDKFLTLVRARWRGTHPPSRENITKWFLHCFPIKKREDYLMLKEGLRLAGLPVTAEKRKHLRLATTHSG